MNNTNIYFDIDIKKTLYNEHVILTWIKKHNENTRCHFNRISKNNNNNIYNVI